MTPNEIADALELAEEGVKIHSPDMPEYKVCAALIAHLRAPAALPELPRSLLNTLIAAFGDGDSQRIAIVDSTVYACNQYLKGDPAVLKLVAEDAAALAGREQDAARLDWLDRNFNDISERGIPYGSDIRAEVDAAIATSAGKDGAE